MIGTRVDRPDGAGIPAAGEYGRIAGQWHGCTPNGHLAGFWGHKVVEHEDGTITVSPSIRVFLPATDEISQRELWHGYLERGIWRSV